MADIIRRMGGSRPSLPWKYRIVPLNMCLTLNIDLSKVQQSAVKISVRVMVTKQCVFMFLKTRVALLIPHFDPPLTAPTNALVFSTYSVFSDQRTRSSHFSKRFVSNVKKKKSPLQSPVKFVASIISIPALHML